MFSALWVEDDRSDVLALAPILLRNSDLSLTVAYFGSDSDELTDGHRLKIVPIRTTSDVLAYDEAYRRFEEIYSTKRPWLLIMDLLLEGVTPPAVGGFVVEQGGQRSALVGVDMALRLHEESGVRNMIWLTNYGEVVLHPILKKKVVYSPVDGGMWRRVAWPRTYILDKAHLSLDGPPLLKDLTDFALHRLSRSGAENQIREREISRLFRTLYSRAGSLAHFFSSSTYLSDRDSLLGFDLVPDSDPPLTLAAWFNVFAPNLPLPEEVLGKDQAKDYQRNIALKLAEHLWGLPVVQLPGILARAQAGGSSSTWRVAEADLEGAQKAAGRSVIGPVCRDSLIRALQNALRNAEEHCCPNESPSLRLVASDGRSLYLLITNPVASGTGRGAHDDIVKRAYDNRLSGIEAIRRCVEDLGRLHPRQKPESAFGNWGFTLVVCYEARFTRCEPSQPNSGLEIGTGMEEAEAVCENALSEADSVTAVFRMPLVNAVEDLAFADEGIGKAAIAP